MSGAILGAGPLRATLFLGSLLWLGGCSLTRDKAQCASNEECRRTFGTGYVCAETGLCELSAIEAACFNGTTPAGLLLSPEDHANYVVFGSLLRTEGKERARHDSALLVIDAINEFLDRRASDYPQLADLRFGVVQCGHDGDVEEVARLAKYLTETLQTPAILGPASSSSTKAAFETVNLSDNGEELRKALFISPSATSVALTGLESRQPGMLWRTAPTDDAQGRLMGRYVLANDLDFMAIFEDTPYGRGLYEELVASSDGRCDDCGFSFDASSGRIDPLAAALASDPALDALDNADVVFFMGAQEPHLREMIRRLDEPDLKGKILFLSDAGASADTVNRVQPEDANRVVGTRPMTPEQGESLRIFSSVYVGRYEESPLIHSFTAHSYDAAWLLVLAATYAQLTEGEINAATIAEGMRHLSDGNWSDLNSGDCPTEIKSGNCLPMNLDEMRLPSMIDTLLTHGSLDIQGASGALDYDLSTEELKNSVDAFEIWRLEPEPGKDVSYSIITSEEQP